MTQFKVTHIEPGTNLWLVIYRGCGDIIVPVVAIETKDVYTHPNNPNLGSCWRYRDIGGSDYVSAPTEEKDELGWPIHEHKEPSWLGNAKSVNQFIRIDEPVGHFVHLGYHNDINDDGLYLTLNKALQYARPSRKKHLARRLRQYRSNVQRFIAATWEINGEHHPGFKKLPDKKIYVRRK